MYLLCAVQVLLFLEGDSDFGKAPAAAEPGQDGYTAGPSWRQLNMGEPTVTTPTDLDFRLRTSKWVADQLLALGLAA